MPKHLGAMFNIHIRKMQKTKGVQSFTLGFSASLTTEKINKIINKIIA